MASQTQTQDLIICLLNCNSINTKLGEIKDFLVSVKPDIFCLTETWLQNYIPKFKNYSSHWKHRGQLGGGLGILVADGIPHRDFHLLPFPNGHLEVQALTVFTDNSEIQILNIYNPNKNVTLNEFEHYTNQLGPKFLVMGDFNAHTPMLSSNTTASNQTGHSLEQLLLNNNICLNNPLNFYTYLDRRSGRKSCLDLCLSTPNLSSDINMRHQKNLGSDHKTIQITVKTKTVRLIKKTIPKWKIDSETAATFQTLYKESDLHMPSDIDTIVDDFTKRITESANLAFGIPKESKSNISKRTPWWNSDCKKAIKERNRAQRKAEKHPTTDNLLRLRKLSAIARHTCLIAKQDSIKTFISTLTYDVPQAEVWNKVKMFKSKYEPPTFPILKNGDPIIDPVKKGNSFAEYYQKSSQMTDNSGRLQKAIDMKISNNTTHIMNTSITLVELENNIGTLKNSSPGPDNIPNSLIKLLSEKYLVELLSIYNQCLKTGTTPLKWKIGHVIPILKPQKSPEKCESYRPVCLLSCLSKLLEKIICKRLEHHVEQNDLLQQSQFGFRPNRATTDVTIQLEHIITEGLSNKLYTAVVYIDLKGAFDCVWHTGLLSKLSNKGITGNLLLWFQNYLKDRSIQVRVDGHLSDPFPINVGVPQGATLSPLLFNIMMNDFPSSPHVHNLIFADDITIVSRDANPQTVQLNLQKQLDKISNWCQEWGFIINPQKTTLQHFTLRKLDKPLLKLSGNIIQHTKEQKLLGLTFDSPRLTWGPHIRITQADCHRRINIMKSIASINYGASFKNLRMFYLAYIRAKLNYGSSVFASASKTNLQKLCTVQNSCLRLMLGARRSSPILSMEIEANIPPLKLYFNYLSSREYLKISHKPNNSVKEKLPMHIKTTNNNLSNKCFTQRSLEFFNALPNFKLQTAISAPRVPTLPPQLSTKNYIVTKFDIELYPTCNFENIIKEEYPEFCFIYTDGSKIFNPTISVGSGMYVPSKTLISTWKINPLHTVMSAELFAIHQALQFIENNNLNKVIIFSDSKSALQLIESRPKTYRNICDEIQILLSNLNKDGIVKIHWVKAHIGIAGNEVADKAANMAHNNDRSTLYHLCLEEKLCILKSNFLDFWENYWHNEVANTSKGKHTYNLRKNVFTTFPLPSLLKNRRDEVNIFRLRIGHAGLKEYLNRTNQSDTDSCDCGAIEDIEHFLLDCDLHKPQRETMCINIAQKISPIPVLTVKLLLGLDNYSKQTNITILKILSKYIRDTGKYKEI